VGLAAGLFATVALLLPSPAAATPVVCIDPGHEAHADLSTEPIGPGSTTYKIKDGGGAPGEATIVLQIGLKLRTVLLGRGYRVVMTRTTMDFSAGNGGNIARAQICNRAHAALMLRLHADGSTDPRRHGISTLYPAWHRGWTDDIFYPSRPAARLVQAAVVRSTGALNLGLMARGDLTGFNWANVPAVLVEEGFMTNPVEGPRLKTAAYQWKVARGLANGVTAFRPVP